MFIKAVYNELIKIAAKPRSYIGLAVIFLLVGVILLAMKADGKAFIEFITASFDQSINMEGEIINGNLMAFIILNLLIIHVPLLVALVTGDLISGEAANGSIRMLLTRPVSRLQVLLSKYVAGWVYTLLIVIWLGILALGPGAWLFGHGDLTVLNSDGLVILQQGDIGWRFAAGFTLASLALITVATLSIALSCLSNNSIGPIVITMATIVLFTLIGSLEVPIFEKIRPFLFTSHMLAWRYFFEDPVPYGEVWFSAKILLAHIAGLMTISLYVFHKKDILS